MSLLRQIVAFAVFCVYLICLSAEAAEGFKNNLGRIKRRISIRKGQLCQAGKIVGCKARCGMPDVVRMMTEHERAIVCFDGTIPNNKETTK